MGRRGWVGIGIVNFYCWGGLDQIDDGVDSHPLQNQATKHPLQNQATKPNSRHAPAAVSSPRVCPALAKARQRSGTRAASSGETKTLRCATPLAWWSGGRFFKFVIYGLGVGLVGTGTRYILDSTGGKKTKPRKKNTNLEEVWEGAVRGRVVEQCFQAGHQGDFPGVERPQGVGPDEPVRPDNGGLLLCCLCVGLEGLEGLEGGWRVYIYVYIPTDQNNTGFSSPKSHQKN